MMELYKRTKTELIEDIKKLSKRINYLEKKIKMNNGEYGNSHFVLYDVENQNLSDDNLLSNEEVARSLLDSVTESVLMQTVDGKILELNKTAAERLGKRREELVGTNIYTLFNDEVSSRRKNKTQEAIQKQQPVRFVDERDGIYFDTIIFPFIKKNGNEISEIIIFSNNITDRINAVNVIRQSEERYRELVEHSPYAIFIHSDGKFIYSNKTGLKLLGFDTTEDFYGRNVMDFVHPDYKSKIQNRISQIQNKAVEVPVIEEKFIKSDGTIIDVETTAMPFNFKGKIAVQVISQDITDRKRAGEALKENQKMLSTLISNLPGIAYRCKNDENWTMEFISDGCKELTGYKSSELINNETISYSSIIHKDDRENVWNIVQKALNEKRDFVLVYRIITSNKIEKWVWEKGEGLYDENQNVTAIVGFITDITEMKISEETVRKLSRAVEQSPASIIITDLNGSIEYVNPKFTEITGYSFSESIGKNPNILKSGANSNELYQDLWNTIKSGNEWRGIFQNKRKDGSLFWESAHISPIKNEEGKVTHYLGIKEDITEQKTKDEKLQNSLKEKEVMLREIHHRVKNNLQIISSLLKLQATYISDPTALDYFKVSQDRVKSMALIHQQLYRSSDLSKINFGDYLRNLTSHLFQAYGVNEKNIRLNIDAKHIYIGIDSAIPCGLLINELISNSLKHAFPNNRKGEINISMFQKDINKYLLRLSDNGVGFPEDIDYKNTKSLGMQLVITLTEQVDGSIELIRDQGTTFNIIFSTINYLSRV
jgi:PAS domain S-box-containing protein